MSLWRRGPRPTRRCAPASASRDLVERRPRPPGGSADGDASSGRINMTGVGGHVVRARVYCRTWPRADARAMWTAERLVGCWGQQEPEMFGSTGVTLGGASTSSATQHSGSPRRSARIGGSSRRGRRHSSTTASAPSAWWTAASNGSRSPRFIRSLLVRRPRPMRLSTTGTGPAKAPPRVGPAHACCTEPDRLAAASDWPMPAVADIGCRSKLVRLVDRPDSRPCAARPAASQTMSIARRRRLGRPGSGAPADSRAGPEQVECELRARSETCGDEALGLLDHDATAQERSAVGR